jgi:hypothetical protein
MRTAARSKCLLMAVESGGWGFASGKTALKALLLLLLMHRGYIIAVGAALIAKDGGERMIAVHDRSRPRADAVEHTAKRRCRWADGAAGDAEGGAGLSDAQGRKLRLGEEGAAGGGENER